MSEPSKDELQVLAPIVLAPALFEAAVAAAQEALAARGIDDVLVTVVAFRGRPAPRVSPVLDDGPLEPPPAAELALLWAVAKLGTEASGTALLKEAGQSTGSYGLFDRLVARGLLAVVPRPTKYGKGERRHYALTKAGERMITVPKPEDR